MIKKLYYLALIRTEAYVYNNLLNVQQKQNKNMSNIKSSEILLILIWESHLINSKQRNGKLTKVKEAFKTTQ